MVPIWLSRTELLLGESDVERLRRSHILIVGLGGVGAYAAEQLCRAGIGELTIVDGDSVDITNMNRQLVALESTIGRPKAVIMQDRLMDINPNLKLHIYNEFLKDERMEEVLDANDYDFVVDAIDTLSPKIFLISHSLKRGLPIVSSMGAGGKMDPTQIKVADLSKSYNCNLARMLRKRLHRLGIYSGVEVVFSSEMVNSKAIIISESENKKSNVGTISYMPAIFGCFCASVVIRGLLKE